MRKAAFFFLAATGLTACGGGGGGGVGDAYSALLHESVSVADAIVDYKPVTSLPGTGTAKYSGTMILAPDTDTAVTGYVGDVSLTADFAGGGKMWGTAKGFYEGTFDSEGNPTGAGDAKGGTLNLSSTSLNPGLFDMTVTGSLAVEGIGTRMAIGTLDAGFAGTSPSSPDAVVANGSLSFSGASEPYDVFLLAN